MRGRFEPCRGAPTCRLHSNQGHCELVSSQGCTWYSASTNGGACVCDQNWYGNDCAMSVVDTMVIADCISPTVEISTGGKTFSTGHDYCRLFALACIEAGRKTGQLNTTDVMDDTSCTSGPCADSLTLVRVITEVVRLKSAKFF